MNNPGNSLGLTGAVKQPARINFLYSLRAFRVIVLHPAVKIILAVIIAAPLSWGLGLLDVNGNPIWYAPR